jgi:hypothetical protein
MAIERAANVPSRKDLETERERLTHESTPPPARRFVRATTQARITQAALAAAMRELRTNRRDRPPPD